MGIPEGRRLRVGIVGLGDIAQKAYLPVLTALADVQPHLFTRDAAKLNRIADTYRVPFRTTELGDLLAADLDAAFVHVATDAHVPIAERLLKAGVHVYIDKPLDHHYSGAEHLVRLAEETGRSLMVGFNRRYAPAYAELVGRPRDLVLMQKNRVGLPDDVRTVVFDDFIHVVDTLRFLAPGPTTHMDVRAKVQDGLLHHVTLHLSGPAGSAIGIMNRDSGSTEERLEVMGPGSKREVVELGDVIDHHGSQTLTRHSGWTPAPRQRGIEQACAHFLDAVRTGTVLPAADALLTHRMCEDITTTITARP